MRQNALGHPLGGCTIVFLIALPLGGGCVPIQIPEPDARYIAFGDSTTPDERGEGYSEILRTLLGEPPEAFTNQGKSGETTEEGLERLEWLLSSDFYPNAEVLLYWEGGNDVTDFIEEYDPFLLLSPDDPDYPHDDELWERLATTQANIESAIVTGRRAGLEVYVATMYFLREDLAECEALPFDLILPLQAQNANVYVLRLNERIRAASASRGATLVDVGAEDDAIRADADNYANCNHLSEQGNAIVADLFYEAIAE